MGVLFWARSLIDTFIQILWFHLSVWTSEKSTRNVKGKWIFYHCCALACGLMNYHMRNFLIPQQENKIKCSQHKKNSLKDTHVRKKNLFVLFVFLFVLPGHFVLQERFPLTINNFRFISHRRSP